ncbi:ATP-binding protein [Thiothrix lacustris]|uniref:AAA family ATPase n=1 Tax=Thiothrix lacustris TaxID=525917 RepID=A0ABY9MQC6_9GAMM|nr:AAA family ATPase [Thiothrix lacustris]WML90782.1 AAA family ATPase [Thiothrix lacustris]WMP17545.1 AAA family ATPase [Thiothrix lacustris]
MISAILRQASGFILARPQPGYRRFLHQKIDFGEQLIGIKGARGCGKTTLLLQYAQSSGLAAGQILYIACDHPAMVDVSLYELAQTFYQEGGQLLLLDEIHKVRGFAAHLKAIRDTFDLRVIFSGSSALRIEHELGDLSRRAVLYDLPVLSLREFMEIETGQTFAAHALPDILANHLAIAAEVMPALRPIEQFKNYLQYGAYPFYRESRDNYTGKLLEVVNLTIDSDLCGIYNIDPLKLDKLKKVLYMLCSTDPVELNVSKLSAAVGASWATLSKYLERMSAGSLVHIVRGGSGMRTVNKPDKLLLDNTNLFYALCAAPNVGSLRESFFVSQLAYQHQVHYHDKGDFLVDDQWVFEIGGANKTLKQLAGNPHGYAAVDDVVMGDGKRIPLWLFGMLY